MKKIGLICAMLCSFALSSSAQQVDAIKVKQHINAVASQLKSLECDFVQTKRLKMLNEKMVSKGKMYYRQQNKLRWEYSTPYEYTFILNETKVLLKNNRRNDVIDVNQNKMFKEIARIMMNSVLGKCLSDEKDFQVSISEINQEWVATLLPQRKDMKQMFQKIILHFNRQRAMVSQVELIERNGDNTLIELQNVQKNTKLAESLFAVE
jgi:outer membrane lipoprotein carrier protein